MLPNESEQRKNKFLWNVSPFFFLFRFFFFFVFVFFFVCLFVCLQNTQKMLGKIILHYITLQSRYLEIIHREFYVKFIFNHTLPQKGTLTSSGEQLHSLWRETTYGLHNSVGTWDYTCGFFHPFLGGPYLAVHSMGPLVH